MLGLLAGWAFAGATVRVDSVTVDGLEVQTIDCTLNKGGLLAPILIVGTLAKNKAALDACAPAGGAFEVGWRWEVGATRDIVVSASSLASGDACVVQALSGLAPAQEALIGSCTARVLVGEITAARAAAAGLAPAAPAPAPAP